MTVAVAVVTVLGIVLVTVNDVMLPERLIVVGAAVQTTFDKVTVCGCCRNMCTRVADGTDKESSWRRRG